MFDLLTDTARLAAAGSVFETLTWVPVAQELPSVDTTVLVTIVASDGEPVWLAYYVDDEEHPGFIDASTGARIGYEVSHWADMPAGAASTSSETTR